MFLWVFLCLKIRGRARIPLLVKRSNMQNKERKRIMNYENIAKKILELVGGKGNISAATYCMTRLRLTPKDRGLVDDEAIKKMEGIIGTKSVGTQYQIIIGPDVEYVYKSFCKQADMEEHVRIDEKPDAAEPPKEKLTFKKAVGSVVDAIGACVTPMLPIITAAAIMKLIVSLLGPSMLNLLPETSDFMRLLTFVGDAGFYFFPVYVAYAGAKRFGTNIPMALFLAGILLHPGLIEIVTAGEPFRVYGIPMTLTTYSSNFISMLLITWVMSYVEKGINKIIPKSLRALLYPVLLTLIMLPLALCILGPIGAIIGQGIANAIVALHQVLGPITIGIVGALWPLLIATGMHQALIAIALSYIASVGFDNSILVGAIISNYAMMAIGLAFLLKAKTAENRGYASSSLVTLVIGGISEPTLFGIILRYKKVIPCMMAGGFIGGIYAGIMKVAVYFAGSGNVLSCLGFAGDYAPSLPHGVVACVIAFAVTLVMSMIFGFETSGKTVKQGD